MNRKVVYIQRVDASRFLNNGWIELTIFELKHYCTSAVRLSGGLLVTLIITQLENCPHSCNHSPPFDPHYFLVTNFVQQVLHGTIDLSIETLTVKSCRIAHLGAIQIWWKSAGKLPCNQSCESHASELYLSIFQSLLSSPSELTSWR